VDLLEREWASAALADAYEAAAAGAGRVVLVTGEPGIGKTALVTSFVGGLDPAAGSRGRRTCRRAPARRSARSGPRTPW
jgi:hypothetical protein